MRAWGTIDGRGDRGLRVSPVGMVLVLVATASLVTGCSKRVAPPAGDDPTPVDAESRVLVHRVAPGESLALIADNYYGDPTQSERIAADNGLENPTRLAAGSTLLLHFDSDSWTEARRRAAALEPYNRGVEALEREDLETAEAQFRLALRTAPELVSARYNLAVVLGQRGRNDEAVTILAELHTARPQSADIAFALGHSLFQMGEFPRASEVFGEVLAAYPEHRRAVFGLARSLQESGQRQAAAAAWRRYLELDPDSGWADQARRYLSELERG